MRSFEDEPVPVIPDPESTYMIGLYGKVRLEPTSTPEEVMAAAYTRWSLGEFESRVEASELLLGRRIHDGEWASFPAAFAQQINRPENFGELVGVLSGIAVVEQSR